MKTAKVMAFYFGERRFYPHNKYGVIDLLKRQIDSHRKIDPGTNMDLILVNHDLGDDEVKSILNSYDGETVNGGIIKIIHRPRISFDLSMGSFKYAFHLLKKEYDYWFFCEDDIETLKDNVVGDMINLLNSDSNIGFIAACDYLNYDIHQYQIKDGYIETTNFGPPHAHGGIGLTSTQIMNDVSLKITDYLETPNIRLYENNKNYEINYQYTYIDENFNEISFTNDFVKAGYKLKSFSDGTNFLHIRENMIL